MHEFALVPTPRAVRTLTTRLTCARQFYNALLGEAHRRLTACRRDPRWQQALALGAADAQAQTLFRACRRTYGYSEFGLTALVKVWRVNVFKAHLDFKCCQDLAVRAFRACEAFRKDRTHRLGAARHLRFARRETFHTVSSIGIQIDPAHQQVRWWGLQLPYRLAARDPDGLEASVLDLMRDPTNIREHGRRITRRIIRGVPRFYVQVTLKGHPFRKAKHPVGHGTVGLDLGPSLLATVTPRDDGLQGTLHLLADGCVRDERQIRRIQRYLDRSRRHTNPHCFHPNGTWKPGARLTTVSKRSRQAQTYLAEVERRLAVHRQQAHNRLVHRLLAHGDTMHLEALSYKGWQRGQFGKSIGLRSVGAFVARLKQQTVAHGGTVVDVPTYTTKLSQLCHQCGTYTKKPRQQTIHHCPQCGLGPLDRDIYSAFLVRFYNPDDTSFDFGAARAAFAALQCSATGVRAALQRQRKRGHRRRWTGRVRPRHTPMRPSKRRRAQALRRSRSGAAMSLAVA
jgi:predicted RNA-binding Zn-ribbon protein involved in translation (DUF1610 family)